MRNEVIEKAKEAICQAKMHISYDEWPNVCDLLDEALAAIESEKPADDIDTAEKAQMLIYHAREDGDNDRALETLEQYADYVHRKKCAECKSKAVKCSSCGDPITVGVCENCAPDISGGN